jgi:predicted DNA-binding protein YlxM (UPF0122 family)
MGSNGKVFYSPQIKKIISFMSKYYKENECYPKLDEIGKELNVSKQRIGILIKDAEKLGLVESHNFFMRKYSLISVGKDDKLKVNNYYKV